MKTSFKIESHEMGVRSPGGLWPSFLGVSYPIVDTNRKLKGGTDSCQVQLIEPLET